MAAPALLAGEKATALGGLGAAANYGTHKVFESLSKREKRTYEKKRHAKSSLIHHDRAYVTTSDVFKRRVE